MLAYDFMQRALLAAILVGLVSPLVGVFLVQRRLALLGDGMGHVALTGVGLGLWTGVAPLPMALAAAVTGAFAIEFIRYRSRTAGDLALALLFYGGIAGGVIFASLAAGKSAASLNSYLFGSLSTVAPRDLLALAISAIVVIGVIAYASRQLFAVCMDPDVAAVQGIRVRGMSTLLAILAAVTVVIGMRVVGLLLVSAIMVVPVAAAQQWTRSFQQTAVVAVMIGLFSSLSGLVLSYYVEVPPGPAIVLITLMIFVLAAGTSSLRRRGTA